MKDRFMGCLCLTLTTIIWGSTFVAQSVGMELIGPFTFQAVRCGLAVAGLLPFIWLMDRKKGRSFIDGWKNPRLWKAGICCALPFFLAANLQQMGLVYTDAGKSAFLTAMYIVIVPIVELFRGKKLTAMIPVSVALAVAGLYMLSFAGVPQVSQGDLYLLGCAFMFAVQITAVDIFAGSVDAMRLNCLQAGFCAVASAVVMVFTETPSLANLIDCVFPLAYAGFMSMGLAYTLQIWGQQRVDSATASLLMSLESAFAVLSGWLILQERMTRPEGIGCVLMFAAVILSQLPATGLLKRRCKKTAPAK